MNALRPELQSLLTAEAAYQAQSLSGRRQRRRRLKLAGSGGFALAASATAIFALATTTTGTLSASEAVAAVSDRLDGSGVLYWEQQLNYVPGEPLGTPGSAVIRRWSNLESGDSRTLQEVRHPGGPGETTEFGSQGDRLWFAPGGGLPLQWLPGGATSASEEFSPIDTIDDVRATLRRAERGEAVLGTAPDEDGISVVTVTDRPQAGTVVRAWITREDAPRVLRIETSVERSGATTSLIAETSGWALRSPDETTMQLVKPPK